MTIAMIFVLIFTAVLLTLKSKNKLSFVFGAGFFAVDLLILSLAIYTMRISNYRYFFQIEFYIMKYLGKIRISFYDTKYLMLISIIAFLTVMMYFYIDGASNKFYLSTRCIIVSVYALSALLFVYVNSNSFAENIYLRKHYSASAESLTAISLIEKIADNYSYVYILAVCVLPYIRYIKEYRTTKMFYRQNYIVSLMLSVFLLQSMFLTILFVSPLRYFLTTSNLCNVEGVAYNIIRELDYYILFIIIAFLTLLGFLFVKSYVLCEVNIFKNKYRHKRKKIVLKDVRHVFHTFKNLMALFLVLDNNAINNYGSDEGMESLVEIKTNILSFSERMNRILDIFNYTVGDCTYVNVFDCVLDAAGKIQVSKNIRVNVEINCADGIVYGDRTELTEIFYNLMANSAEATGKDGIITAAVHSEGKWICISVRDNGCGIDKKMMKRLFKPFASTKKTFNNWGIGLSHVKDVVDAHFGFINVKSKPNEFTEFQIILPNHRRGGKNTDE